MRVSRLLLAGGLALLVAITMSVVPSAQAKTDEDYDKLMKSVGAANGAMRKAAEGQMADGVAAEAKKLQALFADVGAFWAGRSNTEAADWAKAAMGHAASVEKAAAAKNMETMAASMKELGGTCQACHMKNREKTEAGFAIKKG